MSNHMFMKVGVYTNLNFHIIYTYTQEDKQYDRKYICNR